MAEWQDILDDFSGSKSSKSSKASTSSRTSPSTQSSTSRKKKKSDDWQNILDDFSGSKKTISSDSSRALSVAERVKARALADKKEKAKDDRKWYQKGHFEDGYDFGDLTKTILGISDDTASLKDITVNSLKKGYYNSVYGEESYAEMLGEKNKKDEYKKILDSEEYQFTPGNKVAKAVSGASELLGQQYRQLTNPRTLAFVGTAAGATAIAGQAGPQVLLPEEIITVPAAATAAFTAGSAASNYEIEAGHSYNEMIEAGIKEETARKIAMGVGAINAGLEMVQVDELIDAYKVTKASGATQSVAKKILNELKDRGIDVAKETGQEVLQEGFSIGGTQLASKLDKGEYAYNAEEVSKRLLETAESSALSFGIMNAPATARNTYSIIRDNKLVTDKNAQSEDHPIVEQKLQVEQETKPNVEEAHPVAEKSEIQKLYEQRDDLKERLYEEKELSLANADNPELISQMESELETVNNKIKVHEDLQKLYEERDGLKEEIYEENQLAIANANSSELLAELQAKLDSINRDIEVYENKLNSNQTVSKTETGDVAPSTEESSEHEVVASKTEHTTEYSEIQKLRDERQVLQDTIMSRVEVNQVDETTEMLAGKWTSVDKQIRSLEAKESEPKSANTDDLVMKFTQQDYGDFDEGKTFEADGFAVRRDLSADGKRWTYTITSPDGREVKGTSDVDYLDFWDTVTDKLSHFSEDTDLGASAVPADAPVRVVHNDNGDYLESDNSSGDQKWQTGTKTAPRQPKVLTEQPPVQTKLKANASTNKTDKKAGTQPKNTDRLNVEPKKMSPLKWLGEYVVDHGFWVERLAKKTGNRELDARWNFIRYSRGGAQHLIGKGSEANGVKSLKSMLNRVDKAGLTEDFFNYMYHYLNFDRMTVEDRYPNSRNIGVFGDMVSAADSLELVQQYEEAHPEFKEWAEDVYAYNRFLRQKRVEAGIISQKTADLWEEMIPHYVPVRRSSFAETNYENPNGRNAGFDSSVHGFEGSDKDILPLFDTMAQSTLDVYRATAMNGFASELYNTLYPGYAENGNGVDVPVDFFLEGFDPREELLESGELGSLPTLSFYQDGKRHTFDINSEMYESLKPTSDWLSYKFPGLSEVSNLRRALITEYNPWFVLKNAVKDVQDIVINSQHPLETYANLVAKVPLEMATNGRYYQEYLENGGNQNTYFDKENASYDTDSGLAATLKKVTGLDAISKANNIVEMLPRFAEYIASREAGRSIQESMLDASRVTTNFAAGGKFTKLLNRNGATFLNASVQGFVQQARNIVEAKQNGLKGVIGLAARYAAAGIPVFVLNNLVWEDDEEYKELPDYITNNYYIVGKYGDGKFVRLPKGRTAAVIQNAVEQVVKMSSGDDEADWNEFFDIFMENIAPNNPGEDNVFAPIKQVMKNETWYGEDLVPSRLQDLPVTEQYDEKTDSISIWLSEKLQGIPGLKNLELSPKQINYLLDQYSGVVGDTVLPFHTPKAESPSDSFLGKVVSPLRDIFTTDSVLNNRVTGDFYDTLEAAEAQAKSKDATMSDKLRSGILISANVEISKLMKEQREIQTSDLPDSEKYQRNRELKEEINSLQKDALDSLKSVFTDGIYAEAGDKRFNYSEEDDTWWEVKPELADGKENWYYIQEQLSHDKLGMSYADFWNGKKPPEDFEGKTYYAEYNGKRYNYDVEDNSWYEIKPKKKNGDDNYYYEQEQLAHDKLGVSYEDFWNNREEYMDANYVSDRWGEPFYETAKNVFGSEHFAEIASGMADISADKDENGESIIGSRKRKMEEYIYGLDIPDIEKHILFKSQYSYTNKHNYEIIDYLNDREDISYEQMESILKELGFRVDAHGNIRW